MLDSFQVIEKMERETGFEPATSSLGSWHSTTELLPRSCIFRYLTVRQEFSHFSRPVHTVSQIHSNHGV